MCEKIKTAYMFGFLSFGCVMSLMRDGYGKEAWIQHCQDIWIDGRYTVPLTLASLLIMVALTVKMIVDASNQRGG